MLLTLCIFLEGFGLDFVIETKPAVFKVERKPLRFRPSLHLTGIVGGLFQKTVWTSITHGFEGDRAAFTGALALMRTFVRAVGETRPATAGALKVKTFHKYETHGFRSMSRDGTRIVRDDFTIAIVKGMCVSEVEQIFYSIHGKVFQRRSHQLRVRRSVSFSSQTLSLDWASSACALK